MNDDGEQQDDGPRGEIAEAPLPLRSVRAGRLVTGAVRLLRPLGEGAMGSVWVAEHTGLGTEVAVKFISGRWNLADPEIVARFHNEARAAARIKSPHVVQIHDHGLTEDGTPYIVMELLEGESLAERLDREGRLDLATATRIVEQVARALGRAHELGIVHRDIKPDNIFLCKSDDGPFVKVLDFGVAKQTSPGRVSALTSPGVMVGTAPYLSREQITGQSLDRQVDLWALAVVVYECLTGQVVFVADSLGTLCVKICKGEWEPPTALRPELPARLDAFFARAFAVDPAGRFGSARQLADELADIAAQAEQGRAAAEVEAEPPPGDGATGDAPMRATLGQGQRRKAAAVLVLLLLGLAGAALLFGFCRREAGQIEPAASASAAALAPPGAPPPSEPQRAPPEAPSIGSAAAPPAPPETSGSAPPRRLPTSEPTVEATTHAPTSSRPARPDYGF